MKIFDILDDVIKNKKGNLCDSPDFKSTWNTYMMIRYLSMRSDLVPYADWLNTNASNLPINSQYLYLVKSIPKKSNSFIKYISKPKKEPKKKVVKNEDEDDE